MQFKLLTVTALLTVISAQATDYASCLDKSSCKPDDKICIGSCFEIGKHTDEEIQAFTKCGQDSCVSQAADISKFNACLVDCFNKVKGGEKKEGEKKEGDNKEENKKEGDKKDDTKTTTTITGKSEDKPTSTDKTSTEKPKETTTTTKAPAATPSSNAFKVVPSVFAGFVLAALAL